MFGRKKKETIVEFIPKLSPDAQRKADLIVTIENFLKTDRMIEASNRELMNALDLLLRAEMELLKQ